MHSTVRFLVLMLLTALSSTATAFAAAPTEACTVLSKKQVSSALGAAVAEGTYIMPTSKQTCTWNIAAGGSVTLQLLSQSFFNAGKGSMASVERTAASGAGDEAHYLVLGPTPDWW